MRDRREEESEQTMAMRVLNIAHACLDPVEERNGIRNEEACRIRR